MAKVSLVKTEDDFYAAFAKAISEIDGQLIGRGDRVLIKPNLVMPAVPDSGEITSRLSRQLPVIASILVQLVSSSVNAQISTANLQ